MKMFEDAMKRASGRMSSASEENEENETGILSGNAIILEEYLTRYSPAETYGPGVMIQTTADIISELSDMADLDHDEVNAFLIRNGYRPGRNNSGSFGWMMNLGAD